MPSWRQTESERKGECERDLQAWRALEASVLVGVPVMLDMPGGNINASIIMIAERATDLIDRRTPLDSIHL